MINITSNLLNQIGSQISFAYSGSLVFSEATFSNVIHGVEFTASSPFLRNPIAFIPNLVNSRF